MKFSEGTRILEENVGDGKLIGVVGFSGPQAVSIHEHPSRFSPPSWRRKPRLDFTTPGTGTKYIESVLYANYEHYMRGLAAHALRSRGSLTRAMERETRAFKTATRRRVPREYGDLRATARAVVIDNGRVTYNRKG